MFLMHVQVRSGFRVHEAGKSGERSIEFVDVKAGNHRGLVRVACEGERGEEGEGFWGRD